MPKHHKKGVGTALMGTADEIIKMMIKSPVDQQWVIKEITNEGPPHKQALTALVLKRLSSLVKTVEKNSGTRFETQKGSMVTVLTHEEEEIEMPLALPVNLGTRVKKEAVVKVVSGAPLHELLAYTMCIQVIEWAIKASTPNTK